LKIENYKKRYDIYRKKYPILLADLVSSMGQLELQFVPCRLADSTLWPMMTCYDVYENDSSLGQKFCVADCKCHKQNRPTYDYSGNDLSKSDNC